MKRLVQLIPFHHARDAAGSEVQMIEKIMIAAGWTTEVYADEMDEELVGKTRLYSELDQEKLDDTLAVYHYCGWSKMTGNFIDLDCPKALIYHNVTPGQFFQPFDEHIAAACDRGREQLNELPDHVDLAIAHSDYSARELEKVGFDITRTIPFLFDKSRTNVKPDDKMMKRLEGPPVVMFVGRLVPNKAPDDFIRIAREYVKQGHPAARFVLVGKRRTLPAYSQMIENLLSNSGLTEEQLYITDEISDAELMACYKSASLFLSMSRHEGFCVPLLEAMRFGVPIAALARAAVPETLGDAGLLFDTTNTVKIAEMIAQTLEDKELCNLLRNRGFRQLERYDTERWSFVLRVLFEQMLV